MEAESGDLAELRVYRSIGSANSRRHTLANVR